MRWLRMTVGKKPCGGKRLEGASRIRQGVESRREVGAIVMANCDGVLWCVGPDHLVVRVPGS